MEQHGRIGRGKFHRNEEHRKKKGERKTPASRSFYPTISQTRDEKSTIYHLVLLSAHRLSSRTECAYSEDGTHLHSQRTTSNAPRNRKRMNMASAFSLSTPLYLLSVRTPFKPKASLSVKCVCTPITYLYSHNDPSSSIHRLLTTTRELATYIPLAHLPAYLLHHCFPLFSLLLSSLLFLNLPPP